MNQLIIAIYLLNALVFLFTPVILFFLWLDVKPWKKNLFLRNSQSFIPFFLSLWCFFFLLGLQILLTAWQAVLLIRILLFLVAILFVTFTHYFIKSSIKVSVERQESQKYLEASESRFNNFMNHSPFIAYKKRITLDGEAEIIYQNAQCKKIFGDLIGKLEKDYLDPQTVNEVSKSDQIVLETRNPVEVIEKLPVSFYGVKRTSHWKLTKFLTPKGIACIGMDITEQVRVERELREKNNELELFSSIASHDLQAPLRGILQFMERLQSDIAELDSTDTTDERKQILKERQPELISRTMTSALHMRELCERLLILCRIEKTESPLIGTDLDESLAIALNNLEALIIENHVQVIKKEPLPMVIGDPVQLFQLFQNLISNSIKYRKEEAPIISIGCEEYQNPKTGIREYIISIQDNGIGIESEYLDRIFAGFTRLHRSDEYPGFGLGLAICKKIIDRHQGKIWLTSEPGESTTFFFTLKKYAAKSRNIAC